MVDEAVSVADAMRNTPPEERKQGGSSPREGRGTDASPVVKAQGVGGK